MEIIAFLVGTAIDPTDPSEVNPGLYSKKLVQVRYSDSKEKARSPILFSFVTKLHLLISL